MSKESPKNPIPCKFHPEQYITNFCNRIQCLMQLCPKCVCAHSQKHERMKTLPCYESIDKTIENCTDLISKQRQQIKKAKKIIVDYQTDWNEKKSAVFEKLNKAETSIKLAVSTIFEQLKKSYENKIQQQERILEKQHGGKFDTLAKCCQNEESDLNYYEKQFKKSYSSYFIKPLYTQILPKCEQNIKKLNKDFEKLSRNQVNLQFPKQTLVNDLKNLIVDTIQLQLIFYEDQQDDQDHKSYPQYQNTLKDTSGSFFNSHIVSPVYQYSNSTPKNQSYVVHKMPPPDMVKQNTALKWSNPNWKVYY